MRRLAVLLLLAAPLAAQDVKSDVEALKKKTEEMAAMMQQLMAERASDKKEIQDLRKQLGDLRSRALLAEKVEETKRIPVWVCPGGHTIDAEPSGGVCPQCGKSTEKTETVRVVKVARREAIGEKISSALEEEFGKRVVVGVSGTGVMQQIIHNQSDHTNNALHGEGSVDVFLLTRPLPYGLFFIDLESVGGFGPDTEIGTLANLNSDGGRNTVQVEGNDDIDLREAWFRVDWMEDKLHLVAGKIDLSNYFDRNRVANDETTQFLTDAFVNNPCLGNPALNGPGLTAWYETKTGWQFGVGITETSDTGFRINDRPYYIGEADWRTTALGREGNLRLWGRIDDTDVIESQAIGVSMDQEVSARVTVFARVGHSWVDGEVLEEDGVTVEDITDPWAYSVGLRVTPIFESRPRDVWGLSFGQQRGAFDRDENDRDTILETYYRFVVNEHVSISPLIQWVFHTAGDGTFDLPSQDNVGILGLRMQIDF